MTSPKWPLAFVWVARNNSATFANQCETVVKACVWLFQDNIRVNMNHKQSERWIGVVSDYFTSLDAEAKSRYIDKLRKYKIKEDPLLTGSPAGDAAPAWTTDPNKWPHVAYGDIYNYLIDSVSVFSKESLKAYKGLEAYKYLVAGYVRDVEARSLGSGPDMVVRAKVSCNLLGR